MIYVTHDQIEALTLADRIAIMRGGAIQQLSDPHTIYNKPINKYVAGFIGSPGINFLEGDVSREGTPRFTAGDLTVSLDRYEFEQDSSGGRAFFGIRPEHVAFGDLADQSPFTFEVPVDVVEPMGSDTQVWSKLGDQEFRFRVDGQIPVSTGKTVRIGFDPARASIFDGTTELRL
jgi:multiple sugar transport system ATP-binding protein